MHGFHADDMLMGKWWVFWILEVSATVFFWYSQVEAVSCLKMCFACIAEVAHDSLKACFACHQIGTTM